jgi:hypothetical protein
LNRLEYCDLRGGRKRVENTGMAPRAGRTADASALTHFNFSVYCKSACRRIAHSINRCGVRRKRLMIVCRRVLPSIRDPPDFAHQQKSMIIRLQTYCVYASSGDALLLCVSRNLCDSPGKHALSC